MFTHVYQLTTTFVLRFICSYLANAIRIVVLDTESMPFHIAIAHEDW